MTLSKEEREALARQIERGKQYELLLQRKEFLLFLDELKELRERFVRSLVVSTEHPSMCRYAGRVSVLDDVLEWADKAVKARNDAAKRLNRKDEDGGE